MSADDLLAVFEGAGAEPAVEPAAAVPAAADVSASAAATAPSTAASDGDSDSGSESGSRSEASGASSVSGASEADDGTSAEPGAVVTGVGASAAAADPPPSPAGATPASDAAQTRSEGAAGDDAATPGADAHTEAGADARAGDEDASAGTGTTERTSVGTADADATAAVATPTPKAAAAAVSAAPSPSPPIPTPEPYVSDMYTPELPPGLAKPPTAPSSPALDAVLARDDAERARSASGTSVGSGGSGMSGPRAGHGDVTSGRRPRVSSQDLGDAADAEYPSPAPLSMRRPTRGRILDRAAERTAKFLEAVASRDGELDLEHIRALARSGLPDELGVRATYWKILLNYLPSHRVEWEPTVSKHRQLYSEFRLDFIKAEHFALRIPGQHETYGGDGTGQEEGEDDGAVGAFDEDTLDDDTRLFVDIRKDVWRTHSELSFFQADTRDAMTRMLYIYAKLNVGVRYVQGMNELLAPLYYTLSQDPSTIKEDVEPDTFFCFMNLMSVMRDTFIKPLDSSDGGIYGVIKAYSDMLRRHDKELWAHLERQGVNPQFYAFRWLTTLLSREFELPDAIRLWDTLFADPASPRLAALRCCTAMMILQRATLLRGDFATCLKFLQSYPPIELRDLLMMMHRVRKGEVKMADMRREQTATKPSLTGALFGGLSASFRPKLARTKSEGAALTAVEGDADGAGAEVERTASPASTDSDLVIRSSMYEAL